MGMERVDNKHTESTVQVFTHAWKGVNKEKRREAHDKPSLTNDTSSKQHPTTMLQNDRYRLEYIKK